MTGNTDLSPARKRALCAPVLHVLREPEIGNRSYWAGMGGVGEAAYDDHYFPFEGEETLEILEVGLGFCFGGHDVRRLLKSLGISIRTDRMRIGVKEDY